MEYDISNKNNTANANKSKWAQNTNKIDIKVAFTFITSIFDLAIDPTFESTHKILVIDPDFKKLCIIYIVNKSIRIIQQYMSITSTSKKLEKIYADL